MHYNCNNNAAALLFGSPWRRVGATKQDCDDAVDGIEEKNAHGCGLWMGWWGGR